MITFLVCLALLVTAYFTYGRYLERLVGIDPAARTPCSRLYDGVDYVPLPRWRIFLIQLLNIAGLGPIFGAVLGAAYGPVAFLWITFGGIFMGAAHDFIAGVISLRHDGASLPETAGVYLGGGMKIVMRLFSAGLMILVGAVFLSQPASLVAARLDVPSLEGIAFGGFSWLLLIVLGVILVYYIAATLLPVDKIIGRIYPVFGFALLFMAVGILVVLLFGGEYTIPEFTSFENCIADAKAFPIVPMLFTTIACGAISGFHSLVSSGTSSKMIANETDMRPVGYGAMLVESVLGVLALTIVCAAATNGQLPAGTPFQLFSGAVASFLTNTFGLPADISACVLTMCVSALAMTTVDAVARIGRMSFQELFATTDGREKGPVAKFLSNTWVSTLLTLGGGWFLCLAGYMNIWPLFGSANQLLGALVLTALAVFLQSTGRKGWMLWVPMTVMFVVTMTALVQALLKIAAAWSAGTFVFMTHGLQAIIAIALIVLALLVVYHCVGRLFKGGKQDATGAANAA